ncbi:hypothetical protein THASP1DRAFT_24601 [Thamnocephalis sphaerospora]|uniref:MIT domain-containing protein n=1 Tax=Thamnocephalis sphaerospora TaxID=78915 RepID=A0A4P9XP48_9FUNG|nr:hypothetical protein THASP1DRAFT_24601 [Thamnocephalis sphaerospora]|eukprot:RKP07201.1 hypothetical protein THASP1DRAFT_24601 [Thamnocephalis sphaerospora]
MSHAESTMATAATAPSASDANGGNAFPTTQSMLTAAKARANTAVLMDGANNVDAALEAYRDAVHLLTMAMERMSAAHDVDRLRTIRNTYIDRIEALQQDASPATPIDSPDAHTSYTAQYPPVASHYGEHQSHATHLHSAQQMPASPRGSPHMPTSPHMTPLAHAHAPAPASPRSSPHASVLSPRSSSFAASLALAGERHPVYATQTAPHRSPSLQPQSHGAGPIHDGDAGVRRTPSPFHIDPRRGRLPPPPNYPPPSKPPVSTGSLRSPGPSTSSTTLSFSMGVLSPPPPGPPPAHALASSASSMRRPSPTPPMTGPASSGLPGARKEWQKSATLLKQRSMPTIANPPAEGAAVSEPAATRYTPPIPSSSTHPLARSVDAVHFTDGSRVKQPTTPTQGMVSPPLPELARGPQVVSSVDAMSAVDASRSYARSAAGGVTPSRSPAPVPTASGAMAVAGRTMATNSGGALVSRSFSPAHQRSRSGTPSERSIDMATAQGGNGAQGGSNGVAPTVGLGVPELRQRRRLRSDSSPLAIAPSVVSRPAESAVVHAKAPRAVVLTPVTSSEALPTASPTQFTSHRRSSSETTRSTAGVHDLSGEEKVQEASHASTVDVSKQTQGQKQPRLTDLPRAASSDQLSSSASAGRKQPVATGHRAHGSTVSLGAATTQESDKFQPPSVSPAIRPIDEMERLPLSEVAPFMFEDPEFSLQKTVSATPLSERANSASAAVSRHHKGKTNMEIMNAAEQSQRRDTTRAPPPPTLDIGAVKVMGPTTSPTSAPVGRRASRPDLSRSTSESSLRPDGQREFGAGGGEDGDMDDLAQSVVGQNPSASASSTSIDRVPRRKRSLAQLFHRRKQSSTSDIERLPALPSAELPPARPDAVAHSEEGAPVDVSSPPQSANRTLTAGDGGRKGDRSQAASPTPSNSAAVSPSPIVHRRSPSGLPANTTSMLADTIAVARRTRSAALPEALTTGLRSQHHYFSTLPARGAGAAEDSRRNLSGVVSPTSSRRTHGTSRPSLAAAPYMARHTMGNRRTSHASNGSGGSSTGSSGAGSTGKGRSGSGNASSIGITLFDVMREEPQSNVSLEQPPSSAELRPFWLMRCFERSITSGGFLTARLFVPRSLWLTKGVKLMVVDTKIQTCERLRDRLEKMAAVDLDDTDNAITALDELDDELHAAQNQLARKLDFIKESKRAKNSGLGIMSFNLGLKSVERIHATMTKDRMESLNEYVEALAKLFRACQLLDHWLRYYTARPASKERDHAVQRLHRASDFMRTVVCAFVMRDLASLYDKYTKRVREWMTD